ncbi:YncE family protein [Methylobacterium planeticum]|uniref:YncE family protein n=1 Tax=Methylobacterium planeticum TaxID=2615211 RepID=A0A6N6MUQ5_9HYPH|nr:YncE family protein [Methylobacterium planeticum]KAB1074458.1 YncE family protein [Methylobacterium planeticum]
MIRRCAPFVLACLIAAPAPAQAGGAAVYVVSQEAGMLARVGAGAAAADPALLVGPRPAGIAVGPGGQVYLSHPDHRAITVVGGRDGPALRRLAFAGQAFGIAVSDDGASLFVGDWRAGTVSRLSTASGGVEGIAGVGREPAGLALDRAGRLFVADRESRQVSVVDTRSMVRIATVAAGEAPFALALNPRQDRLYVANVRSNTLTVIDTRSLEPVATVPVGAMPYGVAVSPDGRLVLVTNQHAGTVSVLDADRLTLAGTVAVGKYPEGIAVLGGRAYVANWFSDDVSVIDLATLRESERIRVGAGPRAIALGAPEAPGTPDERVR